MLYIVFEYKTVPFNKCFPHYLCQTHKKLFQIFNLVFSHVIFFQLTIEFIFIVKFVGKYFIFRQVYTAQFRSKIITYSTPLKNLFRRHKIDDCVKYHSSYFKYFIDGFLLHCLLKLSHLIIVQRNLNGNGICRNCSRKIYKQFFVTLLLVKLQLCWF